MPTLLDLFCGAGGAAAGYHAAGFKTIVGVDIEPQPNYPYRFIQADALEYVADHGSDFDAIHASPPCQGYSYMTNNLPWNRDRDYPMLILPTREALKATAVPWVIENVMGARRGSATLKRRRVQSHGMDAGYLCGQMFGLPFYRHRLFESSFFWMQPGHPKHRLNLHPRSERSVYGGKITGLPGGSAGLDTKPRQPYSEAEDSRGAKSWPGRDGMRGNGLKQQASGISEWQQRSADGKGGVGVALGHAKGWRLAAATMGIDWMKQAELTQAVPPAYTEYIGRQLLAL
tara:strand:- start:1548 stop:2408 length:861 start_codon:yes stop_codon:yes gene_type:complete